MPPLTTGERMTFVKTKIVATIGPAVQTVEKLTQLVAAGVDVFRLNFAHGQHDWLSKMLANIREVSRTLGRPVGVLGDLSGPKIRLEEIPGGVASCVMGEQFIFAREPDLADPKVFTCTYDRLIDDLRVNDRVLLADGTVGLRVVERTDDRVICVVEQPGEVRSRQGVNLPGAVLSTPSLTEKDRDDLKWALANGVDFISLSFVRSADDLRLLRAEIAAFGPKYEPQIVAKIEKLEAVNDLDQILEQTDVVMVARGDLGVEVDLAQVPMIQKRIIRLCNQHRVPVITATQMLESMTHCNRPTRAEATDVANAVLDGTDAVMLSGETAVGDYPVEAVGTMNRIAHEAERVLSPARGNDPFSQLRSRAMAVTEAVTVGAVRAAEHLTADLIVVVTKTGKTALAISRQRSQTPVLSLTSSEETARRLSLYWGITPLCTPISQATPPEILKFVVDWGKREGVLRSGAKIILIASSGTSTVGHDVMLVHSVP
ncbi:MAG: pyruvate kinase [Planctomycetota bacterium]|nr:pyruvate kinase [Planctomycetota bacterium]